MAEGWAREWIVNERALLDARRAANSQHDAHLVDGHSELNDMHDDDARLVAFLDGLLVLSVALDESAIVSSEGAHGAHSHAVDGTSTIRPICITCDGETCPTEPLVRKAVKAKAVKAMAEDGVDISASFPKSIEEITPQILHTLKQRQMNDGQVMQTVSRHHEQFNTKKTPAKRVLDFLRKTSKEMAMGYGGILQRQNDVPNANAQQNANNHNITVSEQIDTQQQQQHLMVDNLIVLCSCSSLKRRLSDMSKQTFDWDIDAPTDAAKAGEGDGAYIRVSRQIKCKVDEFMDGLKRDAMDGVNVQ